MPFANPSVSGKTRRRDTRKDHIRSLAPGPSSSNYQFQRRSIILPPEMLNATLNPNLPSSINNLVIDFCQI